MPKINPGSNVHGDNDIQTARAGGMQDIDIPEPKMAEKGMLQCPVCNSLFSSREDYISHALSRHQPVTPETETGTAPT
jgi:hypothetical protein